MALASQDLLCFSLDQREQNVLLTSLSILLSPLPLFCFVLFCFNRESLETNWAFLMA